MLFLLFIGVQSDRTYLLRNTNCRQCPVIHPLRLLVLENPSADPGASQEWLPPEGEPWGARNGPRVVVQTRCPLPKRAQPKNLSFTRCEPVVPSKPSIWGIQCVASTYHLVTRFSLTKYPCQNGRERTLLQYSQVRASSYSNIIIHLLNLMFIIH